MAIAYARQSARTRRLNVRATKRQEELIRTGAETKGVSVTDFILESACIEAEHVLADRRRFVLSPENWKLFVAALDRPARVKPELVRLFSEPNALRRRKMK